jgi:hypothetical protein
MALQLLLRNNHNSAINNKYLALSTLKLVKIMQKVEEIPMRDLEEECKTYW